MPTHIFFGPAAPAHMPPNTQTCICSCQHAQLPCSPTCTYPPHTTLLVYTNTYIRYHTGRPAHPSQRTCVGMHTHTSAHTNACTFTQHTRTHTCITTYKTGNHPPCTPSYLRTLICPYTQAHLCTCVPLHIYIPARTHPQYTYILLHMPPVST